MDGGGVEFGLTGLLKMFEERFGRVAATAIVLLIVLAVALFCRNIIWSALSPPVAWLWSKVQGLDLPWLAGLKNWRIDWPAVWPIVQAVVGLLVAVYLSWVTAALVHEARMAREAQQQIAHALEPARSFATQGNPTTTPSPPDAARPAQTARVQADRYAVDYLQPGLKRLVEVRNPERTMADKQESATRLRQLWEGVRADLRRDFGPAVELRFNFGKPYMRLGLSVVDDYEARWIELRDIIRDMRSGAL